MKRQSENLTIIKYIDSVYFIVGFMLH